MRVGDKVRTKRILGNLDDLGVPKGTKGVVLNAGMPGSRLWDVDFGPRYGIWGISQQEVESVVELGPYLLSESEAETVWVVTRLDAWTEKGVLQVSTNGCGVYSTPELACWYIQNWTNAALTAKEELRVTEKQPFQWNVEIGSDHYTIKQDKKF